MSSRSANLSSGASAAPDRDEAHQSSLAAAATAVASKKDTREEGGQRAAREGRPRRRRPRPLEESSATAAEIEAAAEASVDTDEQLFWTVQTPCLRDPVLVWGALRVCFLLVGMLFVLLYYRASKAAANKSRIEELAARNNDRAPR